MPSKMTDLLTKFRRNTCGGVAIMAGLTIGMLGASVIAAVDVSQMTTSKQTMQNQIDSAVLFAALNDALREQGAQADLQAMGRKFILDATKTMNVGEVVTNFFYDEARDRIVGEVTFTPAAYFVGSIVAPRGMTVRAEAAPLLPAKMEIALVLDVSGSMNWSIATDEAAPVGSRRIDALRDGVETLMSELEATPRLTPKFSVIPYATSVDVTELLAEASEQATVWFEGANGTDLPEVCIRGKSFKGKGRALGRGKGKGKGQSGENCDVSNALITDPSEIGAWGAERYTAKNGSSFSLSIAPPGGSQRIPVITQPERTTECAESNIAKYGEKCVEFVVVNGLKYSEKNYFAPRSGVLPQTDSLEDVRNFMNTLSAEGGTAGHIGAAWGLYALTDGWSEIFQHSAGSPASFSSETQKVMIIMTDGDFTMVHDNAMSVAETYDYFQSVCDLARDNGVFVYTVGLRASALTDSELTQCAGSADNYFNADSRSELVNAFEEIASKASRVRLSH